MGASRCAIVRECQQRFGAAVTLVEPNPTLAAALPPEFPSVIKCAVAGRKGEMAFNISVSNEGSSLLPLPAENSCGALHSHTVPGPVQPLADILRERHGALLQILKLDAEGGEVHGLCKLMLALQPLNVY